MVSLRRSGIECVTFILNVWHVYPETSKLGLIVDGKQSRKQIIEEILLSEGSEIANGEVAKIT